MQQSHLFLWLDLEMSGLDPLNHDILEISTLLTTDQLEVVAHGPTLIIHHEPSKLANMSAWVQEHHTKNGLLREVAESTISITDAQKETLDFLKKHTSPNTTLLCGNSIWQDRFFLKIHMPEVEAYLHYRMIDVSVLKELVRRWYPQHPQAVYVKEEAHRAQQDLLESINELRHYKNSFLIK